jgi:negative regulator of sigma-B (phosphoserine phosphatase)
VTLKAEHLCVPRQGETECGDIAVVRTDADVSLLAVIDALGHGPHAATAARIAAELLAVAPLDRGVLHLMESLHAALRGSRGAAAMLCLLSTDGRLQGCGVGNVEMRTVGSRVPTVLTPGILGASVNRLRTFEARVVPGDRLVLVSDGISSRMDLGSVRGLSPAGACDVLMTQNRRTHDDSTLLVIDIEA